MASDQVLLTTFQPGSRAREQQLQRWKGVMTVIMMTVQQFYEKSEVI